MPVPRLWARLAILALSPLLAALPASLALGGKDGTVARVASPFDTVWLLEKADARPLALNSDVPGGARLFTPPAQRGVLSVKEGDLRLTLIGNLPELSQSPVLETVAQLDAAADVDVVITLVRGILLIEAGKDSPGGRARCKVGGKTFEVTLGKGSTVAVEGYSRLPGGTPFVPRGKPEARPIVEAWLFVIRGKADLELDGAKQSLSGPVAFHWDSLGGSGGPLALKKPPDWIDLSAIKDKAALASLAASEALRLRLEKSPTAWVDVLRSKSAAERAIAAHRAAALGKLDKVLEVVNGDADALPRHAAVRALRHHIGLGDAQDQAVFEALLAAKVKAGQAETFMHLLHGFGPDALSRPETYESLIAYLQSDLMGVRHLAADHLVRLVPEGSKIGYDAAAGFEARAAAQAAWRKLIPEGTTPKASK